MSTSQAVEHASIGPTESKSTIDEPPPTTTWDRIWASFEARLRTIYTMIVDVQPLPAEFPFDFALKSYIWRAIYMTAFTLGVRLGGLHAVELLVDGLFPSGLLFLLFYLLLPFGILLLRKVAAHYTEGNAYSVMDVRVCMILLAFFLGIVGAAYNGHFYIADGPPNYFMPAMVGLSFQFAGPHLADSRPKLVCTCVGGALAVGMATAWQVGALTSAAVFSLLMAACLAAINLQILIGEILIGNADMTEAHLIALISALYQHTAVCRLFGRYSDLPDRERTHLSLRKAIFN